MLLLSILILMFIILSYNKKISSEMMSHLFRRIKQKRIIHHVFAYEDGLLIHH
jgi:hypothetical protein